jgi:hypothetical protein
MKLLLSLFAAAAFLGPATPSAEAQGMASMDFFYDNLDPYGSWREVGDYGYVWQPYDVSADWQPYSDGRWVYTDVGWTWDSYEPFGWAVYHYGRWANVYDVGWIWVPGTEWGPGWVSWRHSPNYVGWAPLPPEALFLRAIGFMGWVDDYYDIGPGSYRFVENRNFGAQRLNTVFIDQRQNLQIINQTTNITHISYVNNVVHNGGPRYDQQARYSTSPIQRYRLDRRQQFDGDPRRRSPEHLNSQVRGGSLSMLALPFSDRASGPPRRLAEKVGRAEINHGWKNAGSPAEVQAMRERLKSPDRVPEQLPARPRFERPAPAMPQKKEETIRKPADQPPQPGKKRDDTRRDPDAAPMTPPKSSPGRDRPEGGPAPIPQRPSDRPVPGDRNKPGDPRRPGGENAMPPKIDRPSENKKTAAPPQRMQPRPPEKEPQRPGRPESAKPSPRPQVSPQPQRPQSLRPTPRPEAPPQPQRPERKQSGQRPQGAPAPAVSPPATPRPPIVSPSPARERPQSGGERPGKEQKKPTGPPQ